MSNYFPQKVKIRHILEKMGYEYSVVNFSHGKDRFLTNSSKNIPMQFHTLEMKACHKTIWAIMYLVSEKIPGFIDYVYPFPPTYDKILDTIYELYKQNKI